MIYLICIYCGTGRELTRSKYGSGFVDSGRVLLDKLSNTIHILFVSAPQIAPIGGTPWSQIHSSITNPSGSIAPGADGGLSSSGLEVTTIANDLHL